MKLFSIAFKCLLFLAAALAFGGSIAFFAHVVQRDDDRMCIRWERTMGEVCTTHGRTTAKVCFPQFECVERK